MAVSVARLSWGLWARGKDKEPISSASSSSSSSSSTSSIEFGFGLREQKKKNKKKIASSSSNGKVKRKWQSREERKMTKIDREFDFVLVPSSSDEDGGGSSDSDTSDMSIGWIEPHGPGFWCGRDELDSGFAVLVPCYSPGCKELVHHGSNSAVFRAITNLPIDFSPDCKEYMRASVPRKS